MWFKFSPFPDRADLYGAIVQNGTVYWTVSDATKFLNYADPRRIVKDNGGRVLRDVFPKEAYGYVLKSYSVFTSGELLDFLKSRRERFDELERLVDLWNVLVDAPEYADYVGGKTPRLTVTERGVGRPIQEWLKGYHRYVGLPRFLN